VPGDATAEAARSRRTPSGEHERRLAIAAVAQQVSQVVAMLSMLVAVTVLARRLSLTEFGTYGLLLSLTSYLVFIQASVETAAVKAIAESVDQPDRDRAFSTALSLYTVTGLAAGAVIAAAGTAVLGLLDIPAGLRDEARASVIALGVLTAVGWPVKVFQDVLRGSQLFVESATAEGLAVVVVGGVLVGLGLGGGPLWLLVAVGASAPFATGVLSAAIVLLRRLPYRYRRHGVSIDSVRGFLGLSSYLFLGGIADLVVYTLDRVILAAFRSAAVVGLYEAPIRAHNLVLQVHTTLASPVVPAAARYAAERDGQRTRELLVRGTRYTLAAVVPVTIVLMVLARPILTTWLGEKFAVAATAMTLLVGYWLINGNTGVPGRMLIAAGRARVLTLYAAAVAVVNLVLSLVLTPIFGLNGVVLGTTVSFVLGFPFFFAIVLSTFPVRLGEFAREVWLPAYTTGALMAAALIAVRLSVSLDTVPAVAVTGLLGMFGYWGLYYLVWLRPSERALVRTVILAPLRR
jgi:O-antigen/teichoic acid export membrane protein